MIQYVIYPGSELEGVLGVSGCHLLSLLFGKWAPETQFTSAAPEPQQCPGGSPWNLALRAHSRQEARLCQCPVLVGQCIM